MKFLIIFLSTLIVGISSQIELRHQPNVIPMPNFDVKKIEGLWYIYAAIPNEYEPEQACSNFTMSLDYDGGLHFSVLFLNRLTGVRNTLDVVGYPIYEKLPSQMKIKFAPLAYQRDSVATFLDTDYNSFVVLEMTQITERGIMQFAWLSTRSPTPNEACLNSAYAALAKNNINPASLKIIPQNYCPSC